jgi:DNA-binding NtrC family response regulator
VIFTRKTGQKIVLFQGDETLRAIIKQIFQLTMEKHRGNKTRVGRELGITRSTCLNNVRRYRREKVPT